MRRRKIGTKTQSRRWGRGLKIWIYHEEVFIMSCVCYLPTATIVFSCWRQRMTQWDVCHMWWWMSELDMIAWPNGSIQQWNTDSSTVKFNRKGDSQPNIVKARVSKGSAKITTKTKNQEKCKFSFFTSFCYYLTCQWGGLWTIKLCNFENIPNPV